MNLNLIRSKGIIYLLVVLLITSISVFIIHQFKLERSTLRYTVCLPGIIAILYVLFRREDNFLTTNFLEQFKITTSSLKWLLLATVCYSIFSYISTGFSSLFFDGKFILLPELTIPASKVLLIFTLAFFEEIGWRGYALPLLLKKVSPFLTSLIIGVFWALWHLPGYFVGFGAPNNIPFIVFSIWVIVASFIFTWMYIKSNYNVWTAVLLHFGANLALNVFPIMPVPAGTNYTFYMMTLVVFIASIFLLKKGLKST